MKQYTKTEIVEYLKLNKGYAEPAAQKLAGVLMMIVHAPFLAKSLTIF